MTFAATAGALESRNGIRILPDQAAASWPAERRVPSIGGTPVVLALDVADAEAVFAEAVTAGAAIRQPLADMFWGDRHGQLEDPFGHRWNIAQHLRDVPHDEVVAAAAQAFT